MKRRRFLPARGLRGDGRPGVRAKPGARSEERGRQPNQCVRAVEAVWYPVRPAIGSGSASTAAAVETSGPRDGAIDAAQAGPARSGREAYRPGPDGPPTSGR